MPSALSSPPLAAPRQLRLPRAFLLLFFSILLTSCGTHRRQPREATFIQPWRLYTAPRPYASLHVEIDAVAGAEPPAAWLTQLQRTLGKICDKPGGIRIVRSDTIPRSTAATMSSSALALRYIDGPPTGSAFMYILYYNSALNPTLKTANPHSVIFPYPCAIIIDRNYNPSGFGDALGDLVLLHEAGHLCGAARTPRRGDGAHCPDPRCLMHETFAFDPRHMRPGTRTTAQQHFCPTCAAELTSHRSTPAPARLTWLGPLFRRDAGTYQALSLPGAIHLHCGPFRTLSQSQIMSLIRATARTGSPAEEGFILSAGAAGTRSEVLAGLQAALLDPASPVRKAAQMLRTKLPTP